MFLGGDYSFSRFFIIEINPRLVAMKIFILLVVIEMKKNTYL